MEVYFYHILLLNLCLSYILDATIIWMWLIIVSEFSDHLFYLLLTNCINSLSYFSILSVLFWLNSNDLLLYLPKGAHISLLSTKGRTINYFFGGGLGKSAKKNSTATCVGKKKLNSKTWRKKNTQLNNPEKKNHHELYAGLRSPEHGHTCLLHTI